MITFAQVQVAISNPLTDPDECTKEWAALGIEYWVNETGGYSILWRNPECEGKPNGVYVYNTAGPWTRIEDPDG